MQKGSKTRVFKEFQFRATAFVVAILVFDASICAQAVARPDFAVASIKLSTPKNPRVSMEVMPGGTFQATNTSLRALIRFAYRVLDVQIAGGPDWINTEHYDIVAKPGIAASAPEVRKMMESLLSERFKLAFHRETRNVRAYALTLAKNGPKFHESTVADGSFKGGRGQTTGSTRVAGTGVSLQQFATVLPSLLGYPVLDRTGLTGNYDLEFEWTPFQMPVQPSEDGPPPDLAGTSIFAALQEQLGLKLEARKEPIEIFIIQRAEKASEN